MIAEVLLAAALAPARVQVSADEFRFTLSRAAIRRGAAIVKSTFAEPTTRTRGGRVTSRAGRGARGTA